MMYILAESLPVISEGSWAQTVTLALSICSAVGLAVRWMVSEAKGLRAEDKAEAAKREAMYLNERERDRQEAAAREAGMIAQMEALRKAHNEFVIRLSEISERASLAAERQAESNRRLENAIRHLLRHIIIRQSFSDAQALAAKEHREVTDAEWMKVQDDASRQADALLDKTKG